MIELIGHKGLVVALAYSPDGRTLASASADGTARLWDLATGKLTATLQSPAARAYCVAFSPDGKTLAVGYGGPRGLLQLWDADTMRRRATWATPFRATRGVAFSRGCDLLALAGDGTEVHIWTLDGTSFRVRSTDSLSTRAVIFSPDGTDVAAVTSSPAHIHRWATYTGQHDASLRLSDQGYSIAFNSADFGVCVGLEGAIATWDLAPWTKPTIWPAHAGAVLGVAFTPDGQTLLTGGADGLVKLWDPAGRLRHTFDWKIRDIGAVAFAPDGLTAAAGGTETILVWDVTE